MKLKTTTITQKVVIPAMPDEVYDAFTNAKKHSEFTGSKATGNPTVGSKFTAWDGYISGKNLELEKGKRIVQEWVTTDWPQGYPPIKVRINIQRSQRQDRGNNGAFRRPRRARKRIEARMDRLLLGTTKRLLPKTKAHTLKLTFVLYSIFMKSK